MVTYCKVGAEELLTNSITNELKENGFEAGKTYPKTSVAENDNLEVVQRISKKYASPLYKDNGDTFTIRISIPQAVVDSYVGEKTEDGFRRITNKDLQEAFDIEEEALKGFFDGTALGLSKFLTFIEKKARNIEGISSNRIRGLIELVKSDRNALSKLSALKGMMIQAFVVADKSFSYLKKLDAAGTDPDEYYKEVLSVMEDIAVFKPILEEIDKSLTNRFIENPVRKLVKQALNKIENVENIFIERSEKYAADVIEDVYERTTKKMREETTAEMNRLIKMSNEEKNLKRKAILTRKIQKLRKDAEEFIPDRNLILKTLQGKTQDSTIFSRWMLSGGASADIIVQGVHEKIAQKYREAEKEAVAEQKIIGDAWKELLSSGFDASNLQTAFNELQQEVINYEYNPETNEIEEISELWFKTDQDYTHKTEYSKFTAEIKKLEHELSNINLQINNQTEYKQKTRELFDKKIEFEKWKRETYEMFYTDEYYAVDDILDTPLYDNAGDRIDLRKEMQTLREAVSDIETTVFGFGNGIATDAQLEQLERLENEMEHMANPMGKTGIDLQKALIYKKYFDARENLIESRVLSAEALETWNRRKRQVDNDFAKGLVDKVTRDNWYRRNVISGVDGQFQIDRDRLATIINVLTVDLGIGSDYASTYNELLRLREETIKTNGEPDFNRLDPNEKEKAWNLEVKLNDYKQKLLALDQRSPKVRLALQKINDLENMEVYSPSEDYTASFVFQRNHYINSLPFDINAIPTKFRAHGLVVEKRGDEWFSGENKVVDVEPLWREYMKNTDAFKDSEWYQSNHINDKPLFGWNTFKPKDQKYILKDEPTELWKRSVLKDTVYNDRHERSAPNGLKLKSGKFVNTEFINFKNNNPEVAKFYYTMINRYMLRQASMPPEQQLGMRVPSVERELTIYDTVQNRDFDRTKEQIRRMIVPNEQDIDQGQASVFGDNGIKTQGVDTDIDGTRKRFVPIRYKGRIDAKVQSRNIVETIGQFVGQGIRYEKLNELSAFQESIVTTLGRYKPAESSGIVDKAAKKLGITKQVAKAGENIRLQQVIDQFEILMYGEVDKTDSKFARIASKTYSNLSGFRSFMTFQMDAAGQAVNQMGGVIQQIVVTSLHKGFGNFNIKDLAKAYKYYTTHGMDTVRDVGKLSGQSFLTQMALKFNLNAGEAADTLGTQLDNVGIARNVVNTNLLLTFKNGVEDMLAKTTMIAYLKNVTLLDNNGKVISLFDAYHIVDGVLKVKDDVTVSENLVEDTIRKLQALSRNVNGNYGKLNKTKFEQYWMGRAILMFKKWMIPFYMIGFGKRRLSLEEGAVLDGIYKVTFDYLVDSFKMGGGTFLRNLGGLAFYSYDKSLSEKDRAAVQATTTLIYLQAAMFLALRYLLGYDDDEKNRFKELDKHNWFYQNLVFILQKARIESMSLTPWGPITEYNKVSSKLLNDIIPYHKTITNILTLESFERYERDQGIAEKGDLKLYIELAKIFGNTEYKFSPIDRLRDLEASQKR